MDWSVGEGWGSSVTALNEYISRTMHSPLGVLKYSYHTPPTQIYRFPAGPVYLVLCTLKLMLYYGKQIMSAGQKHKPDLGNLSFKLYRLRGLVENRGYEDWQDTLCCLRGERWNIIMRHIVFSLLIFVHTFWGSGHVTQPDHVGIWVNGMTLFYVLLIDIKMEFIDALWLAYF